MCALCSKAEEQELKRYVPKLRLFYKGSEATQAAVAEAATLVAAVAGNGAASGAAGHGGKLQAAGEEQPALADAQAARAAVQ